MKNTTHEWGDRLPRVEGRNVDLRWIEPEDAPAIFAIFGDPAVIEFWSSPPLRDVAAAAAFIEEIHDLFRQRQLFQWGIALRETNEVVGTCTLYHLDPAHRRAEIGFALRRDVWGHGFASEGLQLALGFAFNELDLHRIEADAHPQNERSLRAMERQGFVREGYLRERWHHLGEIQDAVLLGLLRKEWQPRS